jgi:hypothetical protein
MFMNYEIKVIRMANHSEYQNGFRENIIIKLV